MQLEPLFSIEDSPRVNRIGSSLSLNSPPPITEFPLPYPQPQPPESHPNPPEPQASPWPRRIGVFLLKSSLHVFLISVFETLFFFSYVSVTENNGIVKTIDVYYEPIRTSCPSWGNLTKWALYEVLEQSDVPSIDAMAVVAQSQRNQYNTLLLHKSLAVSGVCLGLFGAVALAGWLKRIQIPWPGLLVENVMMVVLLGLYEYFFFRAIIYNYETLSTQELNAHIVDGLWDCVKGV
jgi:hypothetical protein